LLWPRAVFCPSLPPQIIGIIGPSPAPPVTWTKKTTNFATKTLISSAIAVTKKGRWSGQPPPAEGSRLHQYSRDWPLQEGALTCHLPSHYEYIGVYMFLRSESRGKSWEQSTKFCLYCHSSKTWEGRNPHKKINDGKGCGFSGRSSEWTRWRRSPAEVIQKILGHLKLWEKPEPRPPPAVPERGIGCWRPQAQAGEASTTHY